MSSESDREREHEERSKSEDGDESSGDDDDSSVREEDAEGQEITFGAAGDALEKPTAAAAHADDDGADGNNGTRSPRPEKMMQQDGFSFSNKRLCERWLDNLFMVLYEVSRRES